MRNLIEFFLRYSSWMLFAVYMVAGCFLLFHSNPWQHHVMLTSANAVSAVVYKGAGNLTAYFHLRDINEDLQRRNAVLEREVLNLKQQLERTRELVYADTMTTDSALQLWTRTA